MSNIVNPRMLERLTPHFYRQRCTIEKGTSTRNSSGEPILTWSTLSDHAAIPCHLAPVRGRETPGANLTVAEATHTALLNGLYPDVTIQHRAKVDQVAYNIVAVEKDSQGAMTRLQLRIVTS